MKKAKEFGTKSGKAIGKPRKADYDMIRQLVAAGGSISQVAKQLGVSKSSVSNAIKNKTVS
jgi:DNA invertase Pin-like site-specific DNA recombinase